MASVVITLIGDDQAGLVDALATVVADHGGNWDRSHLAELAGKFAGIVLVEIADTATDALLADLDALEAQGLLAITAERASVQQDELAGRHLALELIGQDHPGIVREITGVLAAQNVNIDELETTIVPAPQGGNLFIANAVIELRPDQEVDALRDALEAVAQDLMVDIDLIID